MKDGFRILQPLIGQVRTSTANSKSSTVQRGSKIIAEINQSLNPKDDAELV